MFDWLMDILFGGGDDWQHICDGIIGGTCS